MPSVLALDQGTTGSTALVIHQDGSVLGRGYREFTQYFPHRPLCANVTQGDDVAVHNGDDSIDDFSLDHPTTANQ